ncbi:AAA-like domain-containing protein [Thermoflexibacter ruber]|uniref:CHAT domain-containing protein n=1 Tax=Thermoflexibacter ruber TaxID=1003 RepID=A0A1I2B7Z2_9BACT|nr:AAA-like domain-containing protein [Thermoflexibacter ruber]SFE51270.1 CHAT domain-containing protein [Thermoflexibacter ruber]
MSKPIFFLAFANDRQDNARYLRNLPKELDEIRKALDRAVLQGKCEVIFEANTTIDEILNTFQDSRYKDRIAVFHFGGHADGYQLLLEDTEGKPTVAEGAGLVSFLARRNSLQMVFLNGCATEKQAEELIKEGIPTVISTSSAIQDDIATQLASRFYHALANENDLTTAWADAVDSIKISYDTSNVRGLYRKNAPEASDNFPWQLRISEEYDYISTWNINKGIVPKIKKMPTSLKIEEPKGAVPLGSPFYIEREVDERCKAQILQPHALIRIKAPRQYGKTSISQRISKYAKDHQHQVIDLNFQEFSAKEMSDLETLLKFICGFASYSLNIEEKVEEYFNSRFLTDKVKCSRYFERYLFKECSDNIVLVLDEADRLFDFPQVSTEFFGMLRAWHEDSKIKPEWAKFKMIITYATEAQYAITNLNQSPFNVGMQVNLLDFSETEVAELASRHQLTLSAVEISSLMEMVGGHPFLVRKALYQIALNQLSLSDFLKNATQDDGYFAAHLNTHLQYLQKNPDKSEALSNILHQRQTQNHLACEALRAIGLVKGNAPNYRVSNKLYEEYFKRKL